MEIGIIEGLITNVGFPIACVVGLAFFLWKMWNKAQSQNEKREEKLYNEISEGRRINEKFADIIKDFSIKVGDIDTKVGNVDNKVNEIDSKLNKIIAYDKQEK